MSELEPHRTIVIVVGTLIVVGLIGTLFYATRHRVTSVPQAQAEALNQPTQPTAPAPAPQPDVQPAPVSEIQEEPDTPRVRSCTVMLGPPVNPTDQPMVLDDGSTLNVQVIPKGKDHVLVNVRELSLSREDYQLVMHKNLVWSAHFDRKDSGSPWHAYRDHPADTVELGLLWFEFNKEHFQLSMNMPDSPPKFVHGDCKDDDGK